MNRFVSPTPRVLARASGGSGRLAIALVGLCLNTMAVAEQTPTTPAKVQSMVQSIVQVAAQAAVETAATPLTLEDTLRLANESDEERGRLHQLEIAWQQEAEVAGYWPKPRLSLAAMNLPTDSLDLHQEPMTQLQLSYAQPLPKGNSRFLSEDIRRLQAQTTEYQLDLRHRERDRQVALLWLDALEPLQAQALVKDQLRVLESIRDSLVARYQYSSLSSAMNSATAGGRQTAQQDLILIELKQESLHDQWLALEQQALAAREMLNGWLPERVHPVPLASLPVEQSSPAWAAVQDQVQDQIQGQAQNIKHDSEPNPTRKSATHALETELKTHPAWRLADHQNRIATRRLDLAREQDKPQWALQASYGYRADDALGNDRADFVSLGVSMEIPWLNSGQANARQSSARARAQAGLIDQSLLMRRLISQASAWVKRLQWQQARIERFDAYQLPKLNDSIQAAQASYQHNQGHFNRLLDAHMALLAGNLERLALHVDRLRAEIQLTYFIDTPYAVPASAQTPNPLTPSPQTPEDNSHD